MEDIILILDANYLSHRAKYTFKDLSFGGNATGVIYGFLKDIQHLTERFQTYKLVFCWDSSNKKRKEVYPEYKNNRHKEEKLNEQEEHFESEFRKQMAMLRKTYLKTIGFKNVFQQDGYESDDIIAAICKNLAKEDKAIIISADQDLFQLIKSNVSCFNPRQQKLTTLQSFYKEYKIMPKDWIKVKAIAGCSSDNVKGIKGVGEKTAIKYLLKELKKESKVYKSIKEGWQNIVLRNRPLVELPYKGTIVPDLNFDENITQVGWDNVTKKLGIKRIRYR